MIQRKHIARDAGVPMYAQLAEALRNELTGRAVGSRFYGDHDICERFSVSRPVARAALQRLVDEGRVHRVRAKGTFVGKNGHRGHDPATLYLAVVSAHEKHAITIETLPGIQQMASSRGFDVIWRPNPSQLFDPAAMEDLLRKLLSHVRGVLWVTTRVEEILTTAPVLDEVNRRIVVINSRLMRPNLTCVVPDFEAGTYNICEHLINLGYRRIGFMGGAEVQFYAQLRLSGFHKAMAAHGLEPDRRFVREYLPGDIETQVSRVPEFAREMLVGEVYPEAFVTATDAGAVGLITVLREKGLRVPEDVAVAGFDDAAIARQHVPALTTVRQPHHELGWEAVRILLDQLDGKREPGGVHLVPCPLVIRDSCGSRLKKRDEDVGASQVAAREE